MNARSLLSLLSILLCQNAISQVPGVGIGTNLPQAMLQVDSGAVLFNGGIVLPGTPNDPPASGGGVRMMWYPEKAAFRAGNVASTQWNKENIGNNSIALGLNVRASGVSAVALGSGNISSGPSSTTLGTNNVASGDYSLATGAGTDATGTHSISGGYLSQVSGDYSFAFGWQSEATAPYSFAAGFGASATGVTSTSLGSSTTADGFASTALGYSTQALSWASLACGYRTLAHGYSSLVAGLYNDPIVAIQNAITSTTPLFIIGNGENDTTRSNALVVRKDGRMGLGTNDPDRLLEISGAGRQSARISSINNDDSALELFRAGVGAFDWRIVDSVGVLFFGRSTDDLVTASEVLRLTSTVVAPGTDNMVNLGSSTLRWKEVFAFNGVINTSDMRDKESVYDFHSGLSKIMQLRPVSFTWKNEQIDRKKQHLGFIAQELSQVLPEVVVTHEWKDGFEDITPAWEPVERLGVCYSEIIPVLTSAIQEQQMLIEVQQELILDLQTRMIALEAKRE